MAGSVALAGRAALLTGAGLVRLAVPDPILETVAGYFPEYTTVPCPVDEAGRFHFDALQTLLTHAKNCTAFFIGPGLGRFDENLRNIRPFATEYQNWNFGGLVQSFLKNISKPIVIDADALNALAAAKTQAGSKSSSNFWGENIILTPHAGEFARLRNEPTPPEEKMEDRKSAALEFARQHGVLLVLKGHETIITDGKQLAINTTGNPGMATGGSGDVLTGMAAGLMAQKVLPVFEAVRLAVYLHGLAGDIAAAQLGEASITATAILEAIPKAFRTLP
jgi:NAD(P)H-hydrate epimerase